MYMQVNNAVKVTRADHENFNRIGVITENFDNGFVTVDFGTHTNHHSVDSLFDITYSKTI